MAPIRLGVGAEAAGAGCWRRASPPLGCDGRGSGRPGMRKLHFSNGSPFARKVRIVLHEKGLDYERDVQDRVRPVEEIASLNPALAVPVLVDRGLTLFDSDLILAQAAVLPQGGTACTTGASSRLGHRGAHGGGQGRRDASG